MTQESRKRPLAVIALGGNAILQPGQKGTAEEQIENVRIAMSSITGIIEEGYNVIITHGNGPQVGNILLQNEEASGTVPAMPLDICGSQTQGMIGYMIQRSMINELAKKGIKKDVATIVTQVEVSPDDPAFKNPTKPIGPFYKEEEAEALMAEKGWVLKEDAGRGWRRVVPSPKPVSIIEKNVIRTLVDEGYMVVASGGGGIPVMIDESGNVEGIEAVIDKDYAGECLALDVEADIFVILTDVEKVALNYGQPDQKDLGQVTIDEMREYENQGHFKAGSMGPKVASILRFIDSGGKRGIITSLDKAKAALQGNAGTEVLGK